MWRATRAVLVAARSTGARRGTAATREPAPAEVHRAMLRLGQDDRPDPPGHGAQPGQSRPTADADHGGVQPHAVAFLGRIASAVRVMGGKTMGMAAPNRSGGSISAGIGLLAQKWSSLRRASTCDSEGRSTCIHGFFNGQQESKAVRLRKGVDTGQAGVHNFGLAAFRWLAKKNQQKQPRSSSKSAVSLQNLLLIKPYA